MVLASDIDWLLPAEIVVAPFYKNAKTYEVRRISEKNSSGSFLLDKELNYDHFGCGTAAPEELDMRTEVALLTRSITIKASKAGVVSMYNPFALRPPFLLSTSTNTHVREYMHFRRV